MTVPDGGEVPRRARRVRREGRVEHPAQRDPVRVDRRVLAVRPADHAGQLADDADRIRALPPEMARVEVHPDVRPGVGPQDAGRSPRCRRSPRGAARGRSGRRAPSPPPSPTACASTARPRPPSARTTGPRRRCSSPRARRRRSARRSGPPGQPAIVTTRSMPSTRASSIAPRSADCASSRAVGSGCSGLPAAFTAEKRQPELGEVAGEHLALAGIRQQPIEVEVRARAPRADAHLDVGDAVLDAPREGVAAGQVLQTVREQADPHQSSFSGVGTPAATRSRGQERAQVLPRRLGRRPDRRAGRDRGVERPQLVAEGLLVGDPVLRRPEGRGSRSGTLLHQLRRVEAQVGRRERQLEDAVAAEDRHALGVVAHPREVEVGQMGAALRRAGPS